MEILLSTAYLPPISYCVAITNSEKIIFEKHEHYVKQTYRSRALIYGANGILPLTIPVQHFDLYKKPIHEVKISYDFPWQKIHWRAFTSSYRNSPYFEFFEDDLRVFYEQKTETLFEWNFSLLKKIFELLKLPFHPGFSSSFEKTYLAPVTDLRDAFVPDNKMPELPEYTQVFNVRFGFIAELSIVDLLFNKGIGAIDYLNSCGNYSPGNV